MNNNYLVSPSFMLALVLGISISISVLMYISDGEITEEVDTIEEAIENDYTFYLNGNEIDPKKYNFNGYKLDYNQEDKVVTMTKKSLVF